MADINLTQAEADALISMEKDASMTRNHFSHIPESVSQSL